MSNEQLDFLVAFYFPITRKRRRLYNELAKELQVTVYHSKIGKFPFEVLQLQTNHLGYSRDITPKRMTSRVTRFYTFFRELLVYTIYRMQIGTETHCQKNFEKY